MGAQYNSIIYPTGSQSKTHIYVIDSKLKKHTILLFFQLIINRLSVSETNADKLPLRFDNGRLHRYKLCNISNHLNSVVLNYGNDKFPNAALIFATPEDLNVELPVSHTGSNPHNFFNHLMKIDLNRTEDVNQFSPASNAIEEEDGVITSVVLDGKKNTSFLLIVDAIFKEITRAEM
ncbi:10931_t:CDS:2 [Gigaspora margarita]|uniref:10931_t:CDS:1 n=1 Tax=Gigaspora margarita TaxID=4874 RepID=A0ABN7VRZ9_GIGMA|nr:10931_t:CDS:2 [Gigaspora margarita]